jgi:hypothetical protein
MHLFLETLANTRSVVYACQLSGLPRPTAYEYRNKYQWFKDAWEDALDIFSDKFQYVALLRVIKEGSPSELLRYLQILHKDFKPAKEKQAEQFMSDEEEAPQSDLDEINVDNLSPDDVLTLQRLLQKAANASDESASTA